jgi:glycosyltransferase involved in cell wall biosynthesis
MRPRVAVTHAQLGYGGSEAAPLWTIEALKHDCEVSLITGGDVDFERLNEYYGVQLKPTEISVISVPLPLGLREGRFAGLRGRFVGRYIKQVAANFDLVICGYGACDFGKPGIQYVSDFAFKYEWRNALDPALQGWKNWWYGDTLLRQCYLKLCDRVCATRSEAWKSNLTLAISDWCTERLVNRLGLPARTLYPPVAGGFPDTAWENREEGFVCVGRVVPEKQIDRAIRILQRVPAHGYDVHLHVLGLLEDSPYGKRLRSLGAQNSGWLHLEGRVFEKRKKDIIAAHRFGIHARENEAFGIAVAEMVKAGCITFAPNSGGQVEIVNHPALVYEDEEDAVRKIENVLTSVPLQANLRQHLAEQARKFSVENFKSGIRDVVFEFLGRKENAPKVNLTG